MMKTPKTKLASLFVFATLPLLAAVPSSVTGKWKIHSNIAGNESDQECTFAQKDTELGGSCKGENGDIKISGKVDGAKVTWKYDSDYNGTALTLTYSGTLDDSGNMKGDVDVQPFAVTGDFTAAPAKADPVPQK